METDADLTESKAIHFSFAHLFLLIPEYYWKYWAVNTLAITDFASQHIWGSYVIWFHFNLTLKHFIKDNKMKCI